MKKVNILILAFLTSVPTVGFCQSGTVPSSFCSPLNPETFRQLTITAIVESIGTAETVTVNATAGQKGFEDRKLQSFAVKVISGEGLTPGRVYSCLAELPPVIPPFFQKRTLVRDTLMDQPPQRPKSQAKQRFLLLGWSNNGKQSMAIEPQTFLDRYQRIAPPTIDVRGDMLFVEALEPTDQVAVIKGGGVGTTALLNLAEALKDAPSAAIRQITDRLAAIPDSGFMAKIEGIDPCLWVRTNVGNALAKLPLTGDLEQFRIGGLLAVWQRKTYALSYLRDLPRLMKKLGIEQEVRMPSDQREDQEFLGSLPLLRGLDSDAALEILWKAPVLHSRIFSYDLDRPSLENQRKIMTYFGDPSPEIRAMALDDFARWYNELDKKTHAIWPDGEKGSMVPREAELRAYWSKKLADLIKP